jgi:putative effector of murein hydrolase LrgA (UPF0299 family)
MLAWLTDNLGTIIVSLILICIVTAVIVKMVKDKKSGKGTCGCGCEHCAMHGKCQSK